MSLAPQAWKFLFGDVLLSKEVLDVAEKNKHPHPQPPLY